MKKMKTINASLLILPLIASCSVDFKKIEEKATLINHYEQVSLKLAKDNRELRSEVKRLEFEVEKIKQEKSYSEMKNSGASVHGEVATHESGHHKSAETSSHETSNHENSGRSIASLSPSTENTTNKDYVEFKTYKWSADDLMKIADKEFKDKKFEKAAQYYNSLINNYPSNKKISDEFYFKAGIASFESGVHHDWTLSHFESLMSKYPTSEYFRSAKLWIALTHMKMGDKKKFYTTVEEFRKKYRNTSEWQILSHYYEKIEEKTNE